MSSPEIYLANRELIEDAITAICRRRRLAPDEADDFGSDARLHLIKDDYAVLRAFEGRSSFRTFVIAVLSHLFLDWRNTRWGKWRPSAEAKRLGPVAVALETMTHRDRYTFDEACEMLRSHHAVTASRMELEQIAARFPQRARRTFMTDEMLEERPADRGAADEGLAHASAAAAAAHARGALQEIIAELPAEDRLIVQMRYTDGRRVQDIARLLNLEPKPLYRRIEKTLGTLRAGLEQRGISRDEAMDAIANEGFLSDADLESGGSVRPFLHANHSPVAERRRP